MNTVKSAFGTGIGVVALFLVIAGQAQAATTQIVTFGMRYRPGTAQPPTGMVAGTGPTTGCTSTSNSLAVGAELSFDTLNIVGIQALCAQPNIAGFWTTPVRSTFIGRSTQSVRRILCPSSMAIAQLKVQFLAVQFVCRDLELVPTSENVKPTTFEVSSQDLFQVATFEAKCIAGEWAQFLQPNFDGAGVLSSIIPLCNGVVHGELLKGYPSSLIVGRTMGQQSEQGVLNADLFDVQLYNFGVTLNTAVQVEIRGAGNMPGTLLESDFAGTQFNVPCESIFVPLNNGGQLFVGYRCTVDPVTFRFGRALVGHFSFKPRNPTTDEASLPILNINVLAADPALAKIEPLTGIDAAFPVVIHGF